MTVTKTESISKPSTFDEALNLTGHGRYNYALVAVTSLVLVGMGMDMFGMSFIVLPASCEFLLDMKQTSILSAITYIGMMLTSHMWGFLSDTKGRRYVLIWSMGVGFVMAFLSGLSPNWIVMAFFKFLGSAFTSASNSAAYTLLGECTPVSVRNKAMMLVTSSLLMAQGFVGLLAYPILPLTFNIPLEFLGISYRPWRLLTQITASFCGLAAVLMLLFHESPKFLASQGRMDEAIAVLQNMYAVNTGDKPENYPVKELIFEQKECVEEKKEKKEKVSLMRSLVDQTVPLFKPPLLKNTLVLYYVVMVIYGACNAFFMWYPTMVNSFFSSSDIKNKNLCATITEGIAINKNITLTGAEDRCDNIVKDTMIFTVVGLGVFCFFINSVFSFIVRWTGKKKVLLAILFVGGIGGAFCNVIKEPGVGIFMICLFELASLGFGLISSYVVDLNPTKVRGMAVCLVVLVGRISGFISVNIVGLLLEQNCDLAFYIYGGLLFSGLVVAMFLPSDEEIKKLNLD